MDDQLREAVIQSARQFLEKRGGVTQDNVSRTAESALTGSLIAGGAGAAAGGLFTKSLLAQEHVPGSLLSKKGRALATLLASLLSGYYAARHIGLPVGALKGAADLNKPKDSQYSEEEQKIIEILRGHSQ